MQESAFDALTRLAFRFSRRISLMALLAAVTPASAAAKKSSRKKKKRRCKKLGDECRPGGTRKCCANRACSAIGGEGPERCCKPPGEPCTKFDDCCSGFCFSDGVDSAKTCLDT
jgi:hypothetical protein